MNSLLCDRGVVSRSLTVLATSGAPIVRLSEGKYGITWREWRLIESLGPGVTMLSSALAEHTNLDRARTSRAITSLLNKDKGFIYRSTVPGDHRKASFSLSEKGCALYASFFTVVRNIKKENFVALARCRSEGLGPDSD